MISHTCSISCSKEFKFEAAHRLYPCDTICRNIHGHQYRVIIHARRYKYLCGLNDNDMVVDFNIIKEKIGKWINDNLDHSFIYNIHDEKTDNMLKLDETIKTFRLNGNPTAENLAVHLLGVFEFMLNSDDVEIYKVTIYETDTCSATAELN